MGAMDDAERIEVDSPAAWGDWLAYHHTRDDGVWLVRCPQRTMLWGSPRRPGSGSWTLLDDVERGVVPENLDAAFTDHPGSRETWDGFPWSARRGMLEWLVTARRADTRARRVARIAGDAARGRRALG